MNLNLRGTWASYSNMIDFCLFFMRFQCFPLAFFFNSLPFPPFFHAECNSPPHFNVLGLASHFSPSRCIPLPWRPSINLTEGEGTALAGGTPARAAAGGAEQSEGSPGGAGKRKHAGGPRGGLRPPAPARSPPLRLRDRVTTRLQRVVSWRVAGAPSVPHSSPGNPRAVTSWSLLFPLSPTSLTPLTTSVLPPTHTL